MARPEAERERSPRATPTDRSPAPATSASVLVPAEGDDVLGALDPRFFLERFDAVGYVLENLPTDPEELETFLRTEIGAVDVARDVIVAKLADDVRGNYNAFIQGMKQVQDVDLDLVRAQIHVKNGRRLLLSAKTDLIMSSLEIVKLKRNRDRVESITTLGEEILACYAEEERMNEALQNHAFIHAVEICLALRERLAEPQVQKLSILESLRHRVKDFLPELRQHFDRSLRKVAEHFEPLRYKELLQAYITLADHSANLGFEFSSYSLSDVLSNIPEIVVRCVDDITRQYIAQVFHEQSPAKFKSNKKGKKKVKGKAAPAASTAPVSATKTIEDVAQCYERLTDLMHTYYLLVQWHRDPFDPRNDDLVHLHRCGIDDDDDSDDGDDDMDDHEHHGSRTERTNSIEKGSHPVSPRRRRSSSIASDAGSSQRSPYSQILCETGMTLLRYRKIVWENMQQNALEVLERLDVTYGFKMEHVIALSQATTAFIDIGEEFTGTPTTKLRSILRIKCEQYMNSFHDDNIELTRMLMDTENWQRVTTAMDGDDDAGLLQLIEKRSGYRFEKKARGGLISNPIYERRVFPSFHRDGNPFGASNLSQWLQLTKGIRFQYENEPISSVVKTVEDPESVSPEMNEFELVLNSSTLSGFVRFCGVYLKMMEYLPHIAYDTFRLLNKLFEFNLYAVFTSFVDKEDIAEWLQGALGDRWNSLRRTVCRISEEIGSGEVLLATTSSNPEQRVTLRRVTRVPGAVENANDNNLFAVAERSIACEAVVSQSRLLDAIEKLARSYLADRYVCLMDEVYERNRVAARELRSFLYSSISNVLVDAPSIADAILQVSWDLQYISEQHNDYVVHIVRKCGEVWGSLQLLVDGSIPMDAREEIWATMVQVIMETMLDTFSSVSRCTPQGRALMSMDLHALQNGLDLINHIRSKAVTRGREYVNSYIKAFYFGQADLVEWIREHKDAYTKVQFVNLIKNGIGASMRKNELRDLVLSIEAILS